MTISDTTPWSVMIKDRGMGHFGPFAIANKDGEIIVTDLTEELADFIVTAVNAQGSGTQRS